MISRRGLSGLLLGVCQLSLAEYSLELGAGGFAASIPEYPGAGEQTNIALPLPYVKYQDEHIEVDREGLTGWLWEAENWHLDISMAGGLPVDSEDSEARRGLPDLDWVLEIGPSIKYYWQGEPRAEQFGYAELFYRKATAFDFDSLTNAGWRYGVGLSYEQPLLAIGKGTLNLAWRFNGNFADARYLDYYYGVEPQYATAERPAHRHDDGYAGSDISLGLVYQTPEFWLGGFLRYYALSDSEQTASPIFHVAEEWAAGVALFWIFYKNRE